MPAEVLVLDAYRTAVRRLSDTQERLPLAMAAHPGAVSLILADEVELWLSPEQCDELAGDLTRLARDARRAR